MKSPVALSIFLVCTIASPQGKYRAGQFPVNQNPADYAIKVHISATHFRYCGSESDECVYADATLDGKKFEIAGVVNRHQTTLIPGDYKAMLPKKPRFGGQAVLGQVYYLLLPDKSAWVCSITGQSE